MPVNPERSREDGLANLLIDVLDEPAVEPELLVRFADDPGSLAAEERESVERALSASPALRDQLRALQSDAIARVLAEAAPAPVPVRPPVVVSAPGLLERVRTFLRGRGGLTLAPLAAAALLALVLLRSEPSPPLAPTSPPQGEQVAKNLEPPPSAPVAPPEARPPEPEAPRLSPPAPTLPKPKPAPVAKPPEPTQVAEQEPTDADYVAMAEPDYRTPLGALTHESEATYVRGTASGVRAIALAPPHTGITTRAAPVLLWYLSELPASPAEYELVLTSGDDAQTLARRELPPPLAAGVQRIELGALGIDLPEQRELRWSVVVKLDPENPSGDLLTSGWIERVPESAELHARLAVARPLDRASVYASAGVWYDAVEDLSRTMKRAPGRAQPRLYLQRLLERAGLPPADVQL